MGSTILQFKPRDALLEFTKGKSKVSFIRRIAGRRSSPNMAIYGENLASLAALKAGYGTAGHPMSVDLIYIDPPYNVGGEQGYRNVWKGKSEKERHWAGDHGAFLDFMEPRLKIGRTLLAPHGLIMVSICDGEYCRLKILMDQIFGETNCIGTVIWNKFQGSASKHLAAIHEYVLVYARDAAQAPGLTKEKPGAGMMIAKAKELRTSGRSYEEAQKEFQKWVVRAEKDGQLSSGESPYKLLHPETFRPFQATPSSAHIARDSRCRRKLTHPITRKHCKVPSNGWKWMEETLLQMYAHSSYIKGLGFVIAGKLVYGDDESTVPRKLQYLDEKIAQVLPSVIDLSYAEAKADLPPGVDFSTPKPVSFLKQLLRAFPMKDAVVLDYFAGSGATAQAVCELNAEDGGCRSWILIEEMGSTFHDVLLKRLEHFDRSNNYGTFALQTETVGDKELLRVFQKYSYDFLSAYHRVNEANSIMAEGMNVIGVDESRANMRRLPWGSYRSGEYLTVDKTVEERRQRAELGEVALQLLDAMGVPVAVVDEITTALPWNAAGDQLVAKLQEIRARQ